MPRCCMLDLSQLKQFYGFLQCCEGLPAVYADDDDDDDDDDEDMSMVKQAAGGSPSMPEISLGKQSPAGQQEKSTLEARLSF